jgi:hypothetical protein
MNYVLVEDLGAMEKKILASGGEIVLPRVDVPHMGVSLGLRHPVVLYSTVEKMHLIERFDKGNLVAVFHLSSDLPPHVSRFDQSGPVDFYVCEICKGRISPSNWDYHMHTVHPDAVK